MRDRQLVIVTLSLCVLQSSRPCCAQVDEQLAVRLRSEAASGWAKLESSVENVECTYREECVRRDSEPSISTYELKYRDGMFLVKRTVTSDGSRGGVWGRNPRYGFEIARSEQARPWVIYSVDRETGGASASGEKTYGSVLRSAWCVFDVPLRAITADPTFELERLVCVEEDGRELVEMEFAIKSTNEDVEDLPTLAGGAVSLAPDQCWAVQGYTVRIRDRRTGEESGTAVVAEMGYEGGALQLPRLKTVDYSLTRSGSPFASWKTEFLEFGACDASPSEFTLTAYGLPEPGETSGTNRLLRVWLMCAAIVCAILAFAIRSRRRAGSA